jgi:hypothetical protein
MSFNRYSANAKTDENGRINGFSDGSPLSFKVDTAAMEAAFDPNSAYLILNTGFPEDKFKELRDFIYADTRSKYYGPIAMRMYMDGVPATQSVVPFKHSTKRIYALRTPEVQYLMYGGRIYVKAMSSIDNMKQSED